MVGGRPLPGTVSILFWRLLMGVLLANWRFLEYAVAHQCRVEFLRINCQHPGNHSLTRISRNVQQGLYPSVGGKPHAFQKLFIGFYGKGASWQHLINALKGKGSRESHLFFTCAYRH